MLLLMLSYAEAPVSSAAGAAGGGVGDGRRLGLPWGRSCGIVQAAGAVGGDYLSPQ